MPSYDKTISLADALLERVVIAETDIAENALDVRRKEEHEAQIEAERLALQAKRDEEQAKFRKELEPVTSFIEDLQSQSLLDPNFCTIEDTGEALRINTGLVFGQYYSVMITKYHKRYNDRYHRSFRDYGYDYDRRKNEEKAIDQLLTDLRNARVGYSVSDAVNIKTFTGAQQEIQEIYNRLRSDMSEKLKMRKPEITDIDSTYLQQEFEKKPIHNRYLDIFFRDDIDKITAHDHFEMRSNRGSYGMVSFRGKDGIYYESKAIPGDIVFFGHNFTRGETSSEDVNTFLQQLVGHLYERYKNHPDHLKKLRTTLQKHFDLDLTALAESSHMLAVAREFSTVSNDHIKLADETTTLDLSRLEKTDKDIEAEIKEALENSGKDAMAILKIGTDVLDLSRALIADLSGLMLPMALGDDYALIDSIKRDLKDISDGHETTRGRTAKQQKKGFGKRLLDCMRREHTIARRNDPNATLSTNFTALAMSLQQRREVVEHRAAALQSKRESFERMCALQEVYKQKLNDMIERETRPVQREDLNEMMQMFQINSIAAHSGNEGITSALASEKKAFLALMKTGDTIPLLASSLIHAINTERGIKADHMLEGVQRSTELLLANIVIPINFCTEISHPEAYQAVKIVVAFLEYRSFVLWG